MSNLPGLLLADKDDVVGAATPATTASTAAAGRRPRVSTSLRVAKSLIHDYEQEDKTIANALKKEELAHRGEPYCVIAQHAYSCRPRRLAAHVMRCTSDI
eukprot:COSAG01_NODE_17004_length_1188_cov_39.467772_1_plen_100_part_00